MTVKMRPFRHKRRGEGFLVQIGNQPPKFFSTSDSAATYILQEMKK